MGAIYELTVLGDWFKNFFEIEICEFESDVEEIYFAIMIVL